MVFHRRSDYDKCQKGCTQIVFENVTRHCVIDVSIVKSNGCLVLGDINLVLFTQNWKNQLHFSRLCWFVALSQLQTARSVYKCHTAKADWSIHIRHRFICTIFPESQWKSTLYTWAAGGDKSKTRFESTFQHRIILTN